MSENNMVSRKLHDMPKEELMRLYYENPKEYALWEKRRREINEEIIRAVKNDDLEACRNLLKESPSVVKNYYGEMYLTLLHIAAKHDHYRICKILIENGADVNMRDDSFFNRPLHFAAMEGHLDVCKLLIDNGADVNVPGGLYWSPLHWAALVGHIKIGELLIERGADVNLKDWERQRTPLFSMANLNSNADFADLLVKHGADINARDHELSTPLIVAAWAASFSIIEKFVKLGADVNAKTYKGVTPLHRAAKLVYAPDAIQKCKLLLKHGADINAKDWNGHTPIDWASDKVKEFLQKTV